MPTVETSPSSSVRVASSSPRQARPLERSTSAQSSTSSRSVSYHVFLPPKKLAKLALQAERPPTDHRQQPAAERPIETINVDRPWKKRKVVVPWQFKNTEAAVNIEPSTTSRYQPAGPASTTGPQVQPDKPGEQASNARPPIESHREEDQSTRFGANQSTIQSPESLDAQPPIQKASPREAEPIRAMTSASILQLLSDASMGRTFSERMSAPRSPSRTATRSQSATTPAVAAQKTTAPPRPRQEVAAKATSTTTLNQPATLGVKRIPCRSESSPATVSIGSVGLARAADQPESTSAEDISWGETMLQTLAAHEEEALSRSNTNTPAKGGVEMASAPSIRLNDDFNEPLSLGSSSIDVALRCLPGHSGLPSATEPEGESYISGSQAEQSIGEALRGDGEIVRVGSVRRQWEKQRMMQEEDGFDVWKRSSKAAHEGSRVRSVTAREAVVDPSSHDQQRTVEDNSNAARRSAAKEITSDILPAAADEDISMSSISAPSSTEAASTSRQPAIQPQAAFGRLDLISSTPVTCRRPLTERSRQTICSDLPSTFPAGMSTRSGIESVESQHHDSMEQSQEGTKSSQGTQSQPSQPAPTFEQSIGTSLDAALRSGVVSRRQQSRDASSVQRSRLDGHQALSPSRAAETTAPARLKLQVVPAKIRPVLQICPVDLRSRSPSVSGSVTKRSTRQRSRSPSKSPLKQGRSANDTATTAPSTTSRSRSRSNQSVCRFSFLSVKAARSSKTSVTPSPRKSLQQKETMSPSPRRGYQKDGRSDAGSRAADGSGRPEISPLQQAKSAVLAPTRRSPEAQAVSTSSVLQSAAMPVSAAGHPDPERRSRLHVVARSLGNSPQITLQAQDLSIRDQQEQSTRGQQTEDRSLSDEVDLSSRADLTSMRRDFSLSWASSHQDLSNVVTPSLPLRSTLSRSLPPSRLAQCVTAESLDRSADSSRASPAKEQQTSLNNLVVTSTSMTESQMGESIPPPPSLRFDPSKLVPLKRLFDHPIPFLSSRQGGPSSQDSPQRFDVLVLIRDIGPLEEVQTKIYKKGQIVEGMRRSTFKSEMVVQDGEARLARLFLWGECASKWTKIEELPQETSHEEASSVLLNSVNDSSMTFGMNTRRAILGPTPRLAIPLPVKSKSSKPRKSSPPLRPGDVVAMSNLILVKSTPRPDTSIQNPLPTYSLSASDRTNSKAILCWRWDRRTDQERSKWNYDLEALKEFDPRSKEVWKCKIQWN